MLRGPAAAARPAPARRAVTACRWAPGHRTLGTRLRPRAAAVQQAGAASAAPGAAPAPARGAEPAHTGYKDALMVQTFGWDSCHKGGWYKTVQAQLDELVALSATHLWLPPPSQSVSDQGYMPGQLYNLNSKYGTAEELKSLVAAARAAGLVPIADIVINHRCADELGADGKWNSFRDDVTHTGRKIDWGKWAITGNDPVFGGTGNPDTGADYGPAPDLDHANPELREALTDWLNFLRTDVGFAGWRLDFVKGYAARFVDEYISDTVGVEALCVGEYWVDMAWSGSELDANQDAARQVLCDWIDAAAKSCAAFDFPTKGILQEAVKKQQLWRLRDKAGKPPGLIGWWPAKAVTFIDNHDTGSTQQHWPFPADRVAAGYAYILTHPGVPCVLWEHHFGCGAELHNAIKTLAAVRRRNGIVSDTPVRIVAAEADLYVAEVGGRVTLKLGPRYDMGPLLPKEADGWKTATWGKDYCVWERGPQA
ncbi:AMY1.2 [Scenedesmus sp. PABB004]|nr:AMY1.2 [Scenedesmus sp. PABB004]